MIAAESKASEAAYRLARALAAPLGVGAKLARLFEPWLLLLTRVWLAQAFPTLQVLSMLGGDHDLSAALAGVWWIDTFRHVAASGPGSAVQALCPLLLALGLALRPAAFLMLVQVVLLGPGRETLHTFWVTLLAGLLVRGPGRFSLEGLLGHGVAESALPGVQIVTMIHDWLDRRGTPIMLVALRLLVATVLLFRSGDTPIMRSNPMLQDVMAMLPPTPGLAASLPTALILIGVLMLAGGLANGASSAGAGRRRDDRQRRDLLGADPRFSGDRRRWAAGHRRVARRQATRHGPAAPRRCASRRPSCPSEANRSKVTALWMKSLT